CRRSDRRSRRGGGSRRRGDLGTRGRRVRGEVRDLQIEGRGRGAIARALGAAILGECCRSVALGIEGVTTHFVIARPEGALGLGSESGQGGVGLALRDLPPRQAQACDRRQFVVLGLLGHGAQRRGRVLEV